jgi:hypothetical protein
MSIRSFNAGRIARAVACILGIGAIVAFILQMSMRVLHGLGLEPYLSQWGIETTPLQALICAVVTTVILGIAELAAWLRGTRSMPGRTRHRARGPIRARRPESRFPFLGDGQPQMGRGRARCLAGPHAPPKSSPEEG